MLRITDADANNWLHRALRNALTHWRYRPSPHTSDDAGDGRAPPAQAMGAREWESDSAAGRRPGAGPPDPLPPRSTARQRGARHLLWEGGRGRRARGEAHCSAAH